MADKRIQTSRGFQLIGDGSTSLNGVVIPGVGGGSQELEPIDYNNFLTAVNAGFFQNQTTIDFGATPVGDGTFTVTDVASLANSRISAQVAYIAPAGKDLDEIEMDDIILRCSAGAGSFTVFARAADGSYLADKFLINYSIG